VFYVLDTIMDGWNKYFRLIIMFFNMDVLNNIFFDSRVKIVLNIPKCKVKSPDCFLHASFVEERIRQVCPEVRTVDIDVLTGNATITLLPEHVRKTKQNLRYLQDRLGNPINVFF
jgi:hypothetical protein